ncbi:uncharacterized protein LOC116918715 isoform X1 [Daphnia magna]|uniref:Transcription factor Adf-1 n=1 Tax=Daphnia magna TaxID=35525 RepID=A0A0P6IAH5_9CRUS|nr:uncharacterized protein LOC116918715 isoform X1 [Daphnia magna]
MMVSTLRTPCAADQLLIEEVRQHEVLYACPTKSNKDNQLRDTAWQEIADAVGKSVEEAKERWRYMRDKYVKELGRNDKYRATNGGSAIEPPDATSFVGLMSFLNPFIKRKSSNGNRTSSSNENHFEMCINPHDMEGEFQSDDERNNSDGGNIEFVSSVSDDGHHLSNGNSRAMVAIKKELVARGAAMTRRQQQQLRREQQQQNNNNGGDREICALPIEATVESVDVSHYHPPSKRQRIQPVHQQQEDTTSLFCASIAGMLAELQPYHRERIKRDIYNLVSDALLTELSN